MDDLFGHRRKPIMPKTQHLEAHLLGTPCDTKLGIGLEDILGSPQIPERRNELLGSQVPKIDMYLYEGINDYYRTYTCVSNETLKALKELNNDDFKQMCLNVEVNGNHISIATIEQLTAHLKAVTQLSESLMDEILTSIGGVCNTDVDPAEAVVSFKQHAVMFSEVLDESTVVYGLSLGNHGMSYSKPSVSIEQSDFEHMVTLMLECNQLAINLDDSTLKISCVLQNIIAHCIRIENDRLQFTSEGKPSKGAMARFSKDVTMIPQLMLNTYCLLQTSADFFNALHDTHQKNKA